MKKHLLQLFAICFLSNFLVSCEVEESSSVEQERIFQSYHLFYNAEVDITYAKATYTFGSANGTKLKLSEGATVNFDGKALPYNELLGLYELEIKGYQDAGTFTHTDLLGNTFINSIEIKEPIAHLETTPTVLDRNESHEIGWSGNPVGTDNASVTATVVPTNLGQTKLFSQINSGAESVMLTSDVLQEIDAQAANLVLERVTLNDAQETSAAGGIVIGSYRSKSLGVTLE